MSGKRKVPVAPFTAEYIRRRIDYDPESGVCTWKPIERSDAKNERLWISWNSRFVGKQCGSINKSTGGYLAVEICHRNLLLHRVIWVWMTGSWPSEFIDHRNGIRDDNRWCNLREATNAINAQNLRGPRKDNTTGFLGVSRRKDKFSAHISVDGRMKYLGVFATAQEASSAYLAEKRRLHEGCTL